SLGNNDLWMRRVREDLARQLSAVGLPQTRNGAPGLLGSYHLGAQRDYETEFLNTGFPGYYGHLGFRKHLGGACGARWGTTTVVRIPYLKSTLVMDVYDTHTKQLVWRGYDTRTIDYNKADSTINKAVEHLTKHFTHDLKIRES